MEMLSASTTEVRVAKMSNTLYIPVPYQSTWHQRG